MGGIPNYFVNFVKWVVPLLLLLFPSNCSCQNTTNTTGPIPIPAKVQCFVCLANCDSETQRRMRAVDCFPVPPSVPQPVGVGCIIAEYWDQTAAHLLWTEQRCLTTDDVIGKWSMRSIVGAVWGYNLTNRNLRTPENPTRESSGPDQRHLGHHLGKTCVYFENLRNGETVEKCYCAKNLCNSDIANAGGVGKASYLSSGSKLEKSWAAILLGITLIFWITR